MNLYGIPVGVHVLKIWDAQLLNQSDIGDRNNELDFVPTSIFRVQKRSKMPVVQIASPLSDEVLHTQNVWVKLRVRGGWTANDISLGIFSVCFRVLPNILVSCHKDIEEPFHLIGLEKGKYEVRAWVATSNEDEVPNSAVVVNFAVTGLHKRSDSKDFHEVLPAPSQDCSTNCIFTLFIFAYERVETSIGGGMSLLGQESPLLRLTCT